MTGVLSGFGRMGVSVCCASCGACACAMALCEPRPTEGEALCVEIRDGERAAAAKADEAKPTESGGRPADMREAREVGRLGNMAEKSGWEIFMPCCCERLEDWEAKGSSDTLEP